MELDAKIQTELDRLKLSHSDHSREFETQLATSSDRLKVSKHELDTLRNQLIDAKRKEVALVAQNETLATQSATLTHKLQITNIGINLLHITTVQSALIYNSALS